MEFCMETKALKSSVLSETAAKTTDDMWCLTGINSVDDSDNFSVDDLLDFSEVSFLEENEEKNLLTFSSHDKTIVDDENSNFTSPASGDFGSLPAGEPPFPVDEVEFLEWLSQFVYDSFSFSGLTGNSTCTFDVNRSEPAAKKFTVLDLPKPVPKKARSKWPRRRPNGNIWSLSLIILTNSLSSSFYSSPNSQGSSISSPAMNSNPVQMMDTFDPPVLKKQKKGWFCEEPGSGSNCVRKCSHCLVEKTPQWRTGPLGPKTLCNACGVRFKLGKLFPEYRPACSPTFASDIHSNSHRKVLEMRRKKGAVECEMSGFMPMVRSIEV